MQEPVEPALPIPPHIQLFRERRDRSLSPKSRVAALDTANPLLAAGGHVSDAMLGGDAAPASVAGAVSPVFSPRTSVAEPMTEWHMASEHPEASVERKIAAPNLKSHAEKLSVRTARQFAAHSLHFLEWLPGYRPGLEGVADMVAGITVGVVLIAQGVAYGMLTGMKAYYGLYAGIVPAAVYGLLGTSRQMHIGPFALVSLLVAEGVSEVPGIVGDECLDAGVCLTKITSAKVKGVSADLDPGGDVCWASGQCFNVVPMCADIAGGEVADLSGDDLCLGTLSDGSDITCDPSDMMCLCQQRSTKVQPTLWVADGNITALPPDGLTPGCAEYVDAALTMSLMVGFMYLAMWSLRLGFVVDLLSDPMMSALTTSAGVLVR